MRMIDDEATSTYGEIEDEDSFEDLSALNDDRCSF